jgi:AraC-like DNA-binding protein
VGVHSQLLLNRVRLLPGEEWPVPEDGWIVVLVESGEGYLLGRGPILCEKGTLIVSSGLKLLQLRASQIGGASIAWFRFAAESVFGLLTLPERRILENPKDTDPSLPWVLPAEHEASVLLQGAARTGRPSALAERSRLLSVIAAALFGSSALTTGVARGRQDAGDRLEEIVDQVTDSELHSLSAEQLAELCRCEKRRILLLFRERFGESLPGQKEAWRRIRASSLLSQPGASIAAVAKACGYEDSDAFRAWFRRQFGKAPAQWVRDLGLNRVTEGAIRGDESEMASSP